MSPLRSSLFDAATMFPWLLALAGVAFGTVVWVQSPKVSEKAPTGASSEPREAKGSSLALKTAGAENQVLRLELDRLRALTSGTEGGGPGQPASAANAAAPSSAATEGALEDLARLLKEQLVLAAAGDARAKGEVAQAVFDMLRSRAEAFSALKDVYLGTADANSRKILLASMTFSGSGKVKDFVMDQIRSEKDPEVRRTLMTNAARYATTEDLNAGLASTFIQSVDNRAEDPATRVAAIRGLRHAPGGEAPDALMRAAADPSEEVRIAAIDVLASRPEGDRTLEQLAASDASPRVREFAQCRLVVAKAVH